MSKYRFWWWSSLLLAGLVPAMAGCHRHGRTDPMVVPPASPAWKYDVDVLQGKDCSVRTPQAMDRFFCDDKGWLWARVAFTWPDTLRNTDQYTPRAKGGVILSKDLGLTWVLMVRHDPAVMTVHVLVPEEIEITQADAYDPEPEQQKLRRINWTKTWHLTASTMAPAVTGRFLAVLQVRRKDAGANPAEVSLVEGRGAIGVRLAAPGGTTDVVAFRTDTEAEEVTCGKLGSDARVFAEGRDKDGEVARTLSLGRETP